MINHRIFICLLLSLVPFGIHAAVSVSGSRYVAVSPSSTTSGLENILVLEDATSATLTYTASSASAAASVKWMRFSSLGGGYAENIDRISIDGSSVSITPEKNDMGYIVDDNGRQTAVWVVNYANHIPTFTSFYVSPDSDCDRTMFTPEGSFDRINYYSINGVPAQLNRGITLEYTSLEMIESSDDSNDDNYLGGNWQTYTAVTEFADITGNFSIMAPLCNTSFHLTGDRFLRAWGKTITCETNFFTTRRVDARTWAVQEKREVDNEQKNEVSGLGGSAPCIITFRAAPTDAAVFHEWQFSKTETFDDVTYRFNEDEFTYTFEEFGNTYVKYVCADASGECTYEGPVYSVMVGESKLRCPNAFSPHNQDGVNDEWKVSYSSLVSYECHIFNRWGKELFSSTNPAEGWDGRIGSKFVPAGVYFYVIKAVGADGKKYNLSGDINIVGSKLKTDASGGQSSN